MIGNKLVYYGPGDVRIEQIEEMPSLSAGEMLVKVEAAAVCGSDIKSYRSGNPKMSPPRTMGHEFSGIVADANGVAGFRDGDRVTMATTIGCGECYYCSIGKTNICPESRAMGFAYDGALASWMIVPEKAVRNGHVIKIVDDIPPEVAALAEPMSCVLNGLSRVDFTNMKYAVVIGLGALGMLHAIALREYGVENIVCCDFPGKKKETMEKLGYVTVTPEELDEKYLELSSGLGFELVVITAPSNKVQAEAPKYARKGGYVSYFASLPVKDEQITISSRILHYNELIFFGTSDSTPKHVREALKIMSAQRDLIREIITVMPISEVMQGIQGVLDMSLAKVVVIPD